MIKFFQNVKLVLFFLSKPILSGILDFLFPDLTHYIHI